MSGICGVLSFTSQPPAEEMLAHMIAVLHHRGPHYMGVRVDGPCGMAATVLDVNTDGFVEQPFCSDAQPIADDAAADQVMIVLDGTGYNYRDIQAALQASQVPLTTSSVAETLLYAYLKFGVPNFIKAFRGPFALAIWDAPRQQLVLIRDRLGQRPLYYVQTQQYFIFASEIKALLAHPALSPTLNAALIPHYLAYGYPPSPETLFAGVRALAPGHLLTVNLHDTNPVSQIEAYWQPPYPTSRSDARSEQNIAADLLAHLRGAVRLRMPEKQQVGAFLSGGLDSATIVALLAHESPRPVKTYSLSFAGYSRFDERRYARQVAARFVTEHEELIVEADIPTLVEELVQIYDQPLGNPGALLVTLLSREAATDVRIAFTGDGGSELLAGLPQFRLARLSHQMNLLPEVAQRALGGMLERLPETIIFNGLARQANTVVSSADLPLSTRYLSWVRAMPKTWFVALLGGQREQIVQEHFAQLFTTSERSTVSDVVAQLLDINLRSYLPSSLLFKLDQGSMAASLQLRAPFLDHQLVHFVSTIPTKLKLRRGTPKYILKEAVSDLLPATIIERKNRAFDLPLDAWFRGKLGQFARDRLLSSDSRVQELCDVNALRAMLDTHASAQVDLGQGLWTLLTLELWMRYYIP